MDWFVPFGAYWMKNMKKMYDWTNDYSNRDVRWDFMKKYGDSWAEAEKYRKRIGADAKKHYENGKRKARSGAGGKGSTIRYKPRRTRRTMKKKGTFKKMRNMGRSAYYSGKNARPMSNYWKNKNP